MVISFLLYSIAALLSTIFGIVYLFRTTFLPYHQEALGKSWEQVDPRIQSLIIGLMRTVGGGFLSIGITIIILLFIPFQEGEAWVKISIPVIGLLTTIPALYAAFYIHNQTKAKTPIGFGILVIVLIILGIIFSFS